MKKVRKAVFPVAGMGTRFLPATKASPKEMLPIVDKPLIQYAVEEAIAAGIKELIFITGRHKRAIEDHFDRAPELEAELAAIIAVIAAVVASLISVTAFETASPTYSPFAISLKTDASVGRPNEMSSIFIS